MNVEENTAFYLNQHGDTARQENSTPSRDPDHVSQALEMVGLRDTEKNAVGALSAG